VIATDTGATSLMVSDRSGWLIPPGDTGALRVALNGALAVAPAQIDEMKAHAVKLVREQFLWEKIAARTISSITERLKH